MIIIQAYKKDGYTLTDSQKKALFKQAKELKMLGYSHMLVQSFTPFRAEGELLEYIAITSDLVWTRRAIVGKKGGLSHGIGYNNRSGFIVTMTNDLEMILQQIELFKDVIVTV